MRSAVATGCSGSRRSARPYCKRSRHASKQGSDGLQNGFELEESLTLIGSSSLGCLRTERRQMRRARTRFAIRLPDCLTCVTTSHAQPVFISFSGQVLQRTCSRRLPVHSGHRPTSRAPVSPFLCQACDIQSRWCIQDAHSRSRPRGAGQTDRLAACRSPPYTNSTHRHSKLTGRCQS